MLEGYKFTDKSQSITKKMQELEKKTFAERAADRMLEIIDSEFRTSSTVWGVWARPAFREGDPLVDTGTLQESWQKAEEAPGIWIVYSTSSITPHMEFGIDAVMTDKQKRKLFGFIIPKDKRDEGLADGVGMIHVPERPIGRPAYDKTIEDMQGFVKGFFK